MYRGILAAALVAGCNLSRPVGLDGSGAPEAEAGTDGPVSGREPGLDAVADSGPQGSGPLTFVMRTRVLARERICDVDGDGALDNALADLGEPAASIYASAVSAIMQNNIDTSIGPNRTLVHFPWIDDMAGPNDPSTTVIVTASRDVDVPAEAEDYSPYLEDDFAGDQRYFALAGALDGCGEPLHFAVGAIIDEGELTASVEAFPMEMGASLLPMADVAILGSFARAGSGFELEATVCGAAAAADLGEEIPRTHGTGELSLLELLLGGGAPFGLPTVPGLQPDLDLDGDGLERFDLDSDGLVLRCIDGDLTTIEGRDCPRDARIADAFSLTAAGATVPAVFAGREPGWEDEVRGSCESPPDESLWDAR